MTSVSYINVLAQRHQTLDQQLNEEMRRPSLDDLRIRELKRKKLELKDEIARLEKEVRH